MKRKNIIFLFLLTLLLAFPALHRGEVLKLKSGVWVNGKILKKTKRAVIVDLGYDVLRIPAVEVMEITDRIPGQEQVKEQEHDLYTAKQLEEVTTSRGVRDFGESVVVVRSPGGLGSGFIINRQGYVITNFHVVKGQKHINITRFKKNAGELKRIVHKEVRIVALDPFYDLAVLQVKDIAGKVSHPMVLDPENNVAAGEKVFVIGNPLGLERTVTEGVVSHKARNFAGRVFLQIDAAINPGNSGGPLFNSRGQVIGVINMGARYMQGLNFAIPIHHLKFLLDNIDAFAYNEANPLSGYVYPHPPPNPKKKKNHGKKNKKE
ncbi:MAG: trypsin-like peptidase domain-containing protein [Candidatus Aminicenantes bacterium]|nr:trypsin-like peptidase domain-containing protein [Candidatus Aminicenantes bacterium]